MKISASAVSTLHKIAASLATAAFALLAAHYPQYQPVLAPVAGVAIAVIGGETLQQAVATHTDGKVAAATILASIPAQSAALGTVVKDAETAAPVAAAIAPTIAAAVPSLAKPASIVETIAQDILQPVPTVTLTMHPDNIAAPVDSVSGQPPAQIVTGTTIKTPLTDNPQF